MVKVFAKLGVNPEVSEEILTARQGGRSRTRAIEKSQSPRIPMLSSSCACAAGSGTCSRSGVPISGTNGYELAIRLQDQAFERMVAPSTGAISLRSPLLEGMIEHGNRSCEIEDRLVSLWMTFRAERLALYRDLGVLPYKDWTAFYADLALRPGRRSSPGSGASTRRAERSSAPAPPAPPGPQG